MYSIFYKLTEEYEYRIENNIIISQLNDKKHPLEDNLKAEQSRLRSLAQQKLNIQAKLQSLERQINHHHQKSNICSPLNDNVLDQLDSQLENLQTSDLLVQSDISQHQKRCDELSTQIEETDKSIASLSVSKDEDNEDHKDLFHFDDDEMAELLMSKLEMKLRQRVEYKRELQHLRCKTSNQTTKASPKIKPENNPTHSDSESRLPAHLCQLEWETIRLSGELQEQRAKAERELMELTQRLETAMESEEKMKSEMRNMKRIYDKFENENEFLRKQLSELAAAIEADVSEVNVEYEFLIITQNELNEVVVQLTDALEQSDLSVDKRFQFVKMKLHALDLINENQKQLLTAQLRRERLIQANCVYDEDFSPFENDQLYFKSKFERQFHLKKETSHQERYYKHHTGLHMSEMSSDQFNTQSDLPKSFTFSPSFHLRQFDHATPSSHLVLDKLILS